jgi:hypothetical protein
VNQQHTTAPARDSDNRTYGDGEPWTSIALCLLAFAIGVVLTTSSVVDTRTAVISAGIGAALTLVALITAVWRKPPDLAAQANSTGSEGEPSMDPDATLAELRRLVTEYRYRTQLLLPADERDVDRIVELIAALDEWLASGGFPPDVWINAPSTGSRS